MAPRWRRCRPNGHNFLVKLRRVSYQAEQNQVPLLQVHPRPVSLCLDEVVFKKEVQCAHHVVICSFWSYCYGVLDFVILAA